MVLRVSLQSHTYCALAKGCFVCNLAVIVEVVSAQQVVYVPAGAAKLVVLSRHVAAGFLVLGELCK